MNSIKTAVSYCWDLVNGYISQVCYSIIDILLIDSFRGFIYILQIMKPKFKEDKEMKEMVNKFNSEYVEKGWALLLTWIRSLMIIFMIITIAVGNTEYHYRMISAEWPIYFLIIAILDKLFQAFKWLRNVIFSVLILLLGGIMIYRNSWRITYSLYENWLVYVSFLQFTWVLMCLNFKYAIIPYYSIVIWYIWIVKSKFDNIPIVLYTALIFTMVLFPITWIIVSDKIKETIYVMKSNQNLIHTIKSILEIFPEGVLIRSFDPISKQTVIKFANENIKSKLQNENSIQSDWSKYEVVPILPNLDKKTNIGEWLSLIDFINKQEQSVENSMKISSVNEQLIELRRKVQNLEESKKLILSQKNEKNDLWYSVKTLKVNWVDNQQSYLHVFIDTSQIKSQEEERAKNKCQQLMFSSVSHELRTPLNAFVNSQQLIGFTLADLKKRLAKEPEITDKIKPLYPKFEKKI